MCRRKYSENYNFWFIKFCECSHSTFIPKLEPIFHVLWALAQCFCASTFADDKWHVVGDVASLKDINKHYYILNGGASTASTKRKCWQYIYSKGKLFLLFSILVVGRRFFWRFAEDLSFWEIVGFFRLNYAKKKCSIVGVAKGGRLRQ